MDWDKLLLILIKENNQEFTNQEYNILVDSQIFETIEDVVTTPLENIKEKIALKMQHYINNIKNKVSTSQHTQNVTVDNLQMLHYDYLNEIACKLPEDDVPSRYKTLLYDSRTKVAYSKLTKHQKFIFNKIHQSLSSSLANEDDTTVIAPRILVMDSRPGMGKSFLVGILAHSLMFDDVTAIVNSRCLAQSLNIPNVIKGKTNCKFIMETFGLSYSEAKTLFSTDRETLSDILTFIYDRVRGHIIKRSNLLILDEYSLCPPLFLATLIVAAKVQKFNLLVTGDKDQLRAMSETSHHKKTNYELVGNLCDEKYILKDQMRIVDSQHNALISKIKQYIDCTLLNNDHVPNNFGFKYFIFETFMKKFFSVDPILDAVYISQFHKKLKDRTLEMEAYMDKNGIEYRRENFEQKMVGITSKLLLPENEKFLPYILLAVGLTYILMGPNYSRKIVKLKSMSATVLEVEDTVDGSIIHIKKIPWTTYCHNCPELQFEWIMKNIPHGVEEVLNFPLRLYLCTFHSIQGLTFPTENIVVDIDCETVNSVYVALSRIKNGHQLKHLYSSDILSLMYTKYRADGYYYHIPMIDDASLKYLIYSINHENNLKFDDTHIQNKCKNVPKTIFESKRFHVFKKNSKSSFNEKKRSRETDERPITRLTAVAKFLIDNSDMLFKNTHSVDDDDDQLSHSVDNNDDQLSTKELLIKYTNYINSNNIKVIQENKKCNYIL